MRIDEQGTVEQKVFEATKRLIAIRSKLDTVADHSNITWMTPHNIHVAGYFRSAGDKRLYCVFNFKDQDAYLTWYAFKEHAVKPVRLFDHWKETTYEVGEDSEHLVIPPYGFMLLEPV